MQNTVYALDHSSCASARISGTKLVCHFLIVHNLLLLWASFGYKPLTGFIRWLDMTKGVLFGNVACESLAIRR